MMATDSEPSPVEIIPEDGYEPVSKYGSLLNRHGVKLVRLEDVFDWMHARGIAARAAVLKIFSPFYAACQLNDELVDGLDEPIDLEFVHAVDEPTPLSVKWQLRSYSTPHDGDRYVIANSYPETKSLAAVFPDLGHIQFPHGSVGAVVYSMCEAARRVWLGRADVRTDPLYLREAREENETGEKYGIYWPKDEVLRLALARVAVPMATAHRLWGWGSVATVEAVAPVFAPAPVSAVADPLGALDSDLRAAFDAVCKRRALSKDVTNGAREPWIDDDVETVRKVRETMGKRCAAIIAPLLGMKPDGVRDLLERKAKAKAKAKAAEVPTPTAHAPFPTAKRKAA